MNTAEGTTKELKAILIPVFTLLVMQGQIGQAQPPTTRGFAAIRASDVGALRSALESVRFLVESGANVSDEAGYGEFGTLWAFARHDAKLAEYALSRGFKVPKEALYMAGGRHRPELLEKLRAAGADVNARIPPNLPVTAEAYRKGVAYLLKNQYIDGSWFVKTRAHPVQSFFESGFPFGPHQWISAAGTSWASIALALTL